MTLEIFKTIAFIICYFIPSYVAISRKHKNSNPIAIVNFFFGWTIIGWIACIAWALSDNIEHPKY